MKAWSELSWNLNLTTTSVCDDFSNPGHIVEKLAIKFFNCVSKGIVVAKSK